MKTSPLLSLTKWQTHSLGQSKGNIFLCFSAQIPVMIPVSFLTNGTTIFGRHTRSTFKQTFLNLLAKIADW
jgi:hypothetical protein